MSDGRQWALILGVSSGFGAATAIELASQGYCIAGVHLDGRRAAKGLAMLSTQLDQTGVEVLLFNANAAKERTRHQVCKALEGVDGGPANVKVMLHSLAFGALRPLVASDDAETVDAMSLEMTVDVMGHSLVYWSQELLSRGLMSDGGRILAMTSAGSRLAWPNYGAVSAAKAALEAHCRQLARELAPRGITANAILAGITDTPALRKIPDHERMLALALKRHPRGRLTCPEDVARAIGLLIRPEADWVTGNTLLVDGGETISG